MELPKRKNNRIEHYDYSQTGAYFITICTRERKNFLWKNVGAIIDRPCNVPLNETGKIVEACIREIPKRYPAVSLDHYVIMPDHVHLLLQIQTDVDGRSLIAPTISELVKQTKGAISKQVGCSIWQKGFYDHVIRNQDDYKDTWEYIENNPLAWQLKKDGQS